MDVKDLKSEISAVLFWPAVVGILVLMIYFLATNWEFIWTDQDLSTKLLGLIFYGGGISGLIWIAMDRLRSKPKRP